MGDVRDNDFVDICLRISRTCFCRREYDDSCFKSLKSRHASLEYAECLPPQSLYLLTVKPVLFAVCPLMIRTKFTLTLDLLAAGSVSMPGSAALLHQRAVLTRAIAKLRLKIATARLVLGYPFRLLRRLILIGGPPKTESMSAVLVIRQDEIDDCLAAKMIVWVTNRLSLQQSSEPLPGELEQRL